MLDQEEQARQIAQSCIPGVEGFKTVLMHVRASKTYRIRAPITGPNKATAFWNLTVADACPQTFRAPMTSAPDGLASGFGLHVASEIAGTILCNWIQGSERIKTLLWHRRL